MQNEFLFYYLCTQFEKLCKSPVGLQKNTLIYMGLLQTKFSKYRQPQEYMAMGVYPYFREIDSAQDTEVTMDGKKV